MTTAFEIKLPASLVEDFAERVRAELAIDLIDDAASQVKGGLQASDSALAKEATGIAIRRIDRAFDRSTGCDFGGPF